MFGELGLNVADDSPYWAGPTLLAWGAGSIAELSQAIDGELKTAQERCRCTRTRSRSRAPSPTARQSRSTQALKMPTRAEAIGRGRLPALLSPAAADRRPASSARRPGGQPDQDDQREGTGRRGRAGRGTPRLAASLQRPAVPSRRRRDAGRSRDSASEQAITHAAARFSSTASRKGQTPWLKEMAVLVRRHHGARRQDRRPDGRARRSS